MYCKGTKKTVTQVMAGVIVVTVFLLSVDEYFLFNKVIE